MKRCKCDSCGGSYKPGSGQCPYCRVWFEPEHEEPTTIKPTGGYGDYSVAIGSGAYSCGNNSIAIGSSARVWNE